MKVRISNLPSFNGEEEVRELLKKYGALKELRIIPDRYTQNDLVIVFVEFLNFQKVSLALKELNNLVFDSIKVEAKEIQNQ